MKHEPEVQSTQDLSVLVVERATVYRSTIVDMLTRGAGYDTIAIADPRIGLARMKESRPDVVLLGLETAGAEALAFLRHLIARDPVPVVVYAEPIGRGPELALEALAAGAVEVATRPQPGTDPAGACSRRLADTVRAAAGARPTLASEAAGREAPETLERGLATPAAARPVVMGGGTGGIAALRAVLRSMPPASPGLVIAQHLPAGFTGPLAAWLDRDCRLDVREARNGDPVAAGTALIAPGDRHLVVTGPPGRFQVEVVDDASAGGDRRRVDLLFRSVAACAGGRAVGVVLTGSGEDGAEGLLEMRRTGAVTLAQDPETCVAPGMPQSAIRRGAVAETAPLSRLAARILGCAA